LLARVRSAQSAHAQALGKINKQFEAGDRDGRCPRLDGRGGPTLDRLQQELAALAELQARQARAGRLSQAASARSAGWSGSAWPPAGGLHGGLAAGPRHRAAAQ
jgi:hypothetical protein